MIQDSERLNREDAQVFEEARPRLLGLAYRILGSRADAEDAVQDSFLKWARAERGEIENAAAWLTTICVRRCLDLQRAAHRSRVNYVGAWLPEAVHTPVESDAEARLDLAASLTTAFLLMLERLKPKERAAYLLHEIFEMPYPEIADMLEITESTCRKWVSRAKAHIDQAKVRHVTPLEQQDQLLAAFRAAVEEGTTGPLAELLSSDIRLSTDGGGKVVALRDTLEGREAVLRFVSQGLSRYWIGFDWVVTELNGGRGVLLEKEGETVAAVSFAYDEAGKATGIFILRNPDKLAHLGPVVIH
ncbi:sigma-70 family RNA polymerase sigma factor [Pelagibius litoralis]|uniref:Sigma-70 family RNA polymerase sigma factor n=1 Tax=Pelagibius litoralis TaxID=374515 RepID=A0A967EZ41_9PROT|nr:sigma-70 family RNA polymerase sigma factor [Pelagibius litoralis]NIA70071.1 sigma-70 family RNA polymerase sigma factor [Pelagibius litoralis]